MNYEISVGSVLRYTGVKFNGNSNLTKGNLYRVLSKEVICGEVFIGIEDDIYKSGKDSLLSLWEEELFAFEVIY